jgi:hypothetical protein
LLFGRSGVAERRQPGGCAAGAASGDDQVGLQRLLAAGAAAGAAVGGGVQDADTGDTIPRVRPMISAPAELARLLSQAAEES